MDYVVCIPTFWRRSVADQDSQSSKATRRRLLQLQSSSAELVVGVLAILLLAASVMR
jgi:two-component system sensor kinase